MSSIAPTPLEEVEQVVLDAVARFGPGFLSDPRRTRAIVSDLLARSEADDGGGTRAVVAVAAAFGSGPSSLRELRDRASATVAEPLLSWAVALVGDAVGLDDGSSDQRRPTGWIVVLVLVVSVAAAVLLVRRDDSADPDRSTRGEETTTTRGGAAVPVGSTTTTADVVESMSLRTGEVREGAFLVERVWNFVGTDLEVTATVRPRPGVSPNGQHQEVLVDNRATSLDPPPARLVGNVAVYPVALTTEGAGEFRISYRVPWDVARNEEQLRQLFDRWRPTRDASFAAIDDPPEPFGEPVVQP